MIYPDKISPWQLLEYMRLQRWQVGPATGDPGSAWNGRFWRDKKPGDGSPNPPVVIITPHTRDYQAYTGTVMKALETLAKAEGRSLLAVAQDIMALHTDQSPRIVQSIKGIQYWWHPEAKRYYNDEQFIHTDVLVALEDEGHEEFEVLEA